MPFESPEYFKKLSDEDIIKELAAQFATSLGRLKNARATAEKRMTIGDDTDGLTPSQRIYGEGNDYAEVNRTCLSVLCLKWLMTRDYDAFTATQPEVVKLTRKSFDFLCHLVHTYLADNGNEALSALIVEIVVGDIGKDESLGEEVKVKLGRDDINHDEVVYQAAINGILDENLNLLRPEFRRDVITGLEWASAVNISQMAQAENLPANLRFFETLRKQRRDRAFDLKYIEVILDVSGSSGHIDSRSATSMIEPVFQGYGWCRTALENIMHADFNARQAYDFVLEQRGHLLVSKGFKPLDIKDPRERALLRLMSTCRVADKTKAELVVEAFDTLRNRTRQRLIDGLNVDGINDGEGILLYYIPALFAFAFNSMKDHSKSKKIEALTAVMRLMVRVYANTKPNPGTPGHVTERNLAFVLDQFSTPADVARFTNDPSVLDSLPLPWEQSEQDTVDATTGS